VEDTVHAFTPHAPLGEYGQPAAGPLSDLGFAVKDLFDVAGTVTGAGTPAWADGRAPAALDAPVVARLRAAGARFVGKTITDELAWSLGGENTHYGAPGNPAAPGRVTGGSSSGSAAAVAAGLADVALGTDTGGSIRLPASYTGLWGLRTTHGALPMTGVVPLAPSYDTVGWFARDAHTLARVGASLWPDAPAPRRVTRLLVAEDLFDRVEVAHAERLRASAARLADALGCAAETVTLAPDGIGVWRETFRVCQAAEAWASHGAWITERRPDLGRDIAERFRMACALPPEEIAAARTRRTVIAARVADLLQGGGLLLVPGAPAPAPLRGQSSGDLAAARAAALDLLCPASHAGVPQLALPGILTEIGPVGLGLIAARSRDLDLLAVAERVDETACLEGDAV
jgi:amidase